MRVLRAFVHSTLEKPCAVLSTCMPPYCEVWPLCTTTSMLYSIVHAHVQTYMCTHTNIHVQTYTHLAPFLHTRAHTCTHTYAHIQTYTHTHIQAYTHARNTHIQTCYMCVVCESCHSKCKPCRTVSKSSASPTMSNRVGHILNVPCRTVSKRVLFFHARPDRVEVNHVTMSAWFGRTPVV